MNDLGKVFSFIVLILSGAFMVLAAVVNATHVDNKTRAAELEGENTRLSASVRELKAAVERGRTELAQEQAARVAALASLQQQVNAANTQLTSAETSLREESSRATLLNQTLSQTQDELKRVTDENENIRQQIAQVLEDRNDLRTRVIARTDELYGLESLLSDARTRVEALQDQLTVLQAQNNAKSATLAAAGLPEDPEDTAPADVRGVVTAVSNNDLVEISLGRDDGIRTGHTLDVYRGNQYLGKIRIQRVDDDRAVGEILRSYRRGYIQQNDVVAPSIG